MPNHLAAFFVGIACGGLFGYSQCITSGINLESPWSSMTALQTGIFTSSLFFGAMIGAITGGFVSDAVGPRTAIGISGVVAFFCAGGLEAQNNLWIVVVLRVISGWSVGCTASVGPLYLGENTAPKYRGIFGSLFQVSVCVGVILAYLVNYAFSFMRDGSYAWRWEYLSTAFFPLMLMVEYFVIPESAGYREKRLEEWRRKSAVDDDCAGVNIGAEGSSAERDGRGSKGGILKNLREIVAAAAANKRAFIVGLMMAVFQQITGIQIFMMYSPMLIAQAGVSNSRMQLLLTIAVGGWSLITVFVAVGLVDVLGRRPLLLGGFGLMFVGNVMAAVSVFVKALGSKSYVLFFSGLAVFLLGFFMGPGPLFFLLSSELFPVDVRGRAMGIMGFVNWMTNFAVVTLFPYINAAVGLGWVSVGLACLCAVIIVFIIPVVPETKGRTLEGARVKRDYEEV